MKTPGLMRTTLIAMTPGAATYIWFFGPGVAINLILAMLTAILAEALMLGLRSQPMRRLADGSALLTGALLGACLPPLLPFHLVILGVAFAIVFGKHVYGGTGQNLFNPAMVGFAVLIVSFPLAMSFWPAPGSDQSLGAVLDAKQTFGKANDAYDGVTAATPLDAYRFRGGQTNQEFLSGSRLEDWYAWAMINAAYLIGGMYLLRKKIIPWQTPTALLLTLTVLAVLFYDGGSSTSLGSPLFHLFSGATMLAAFFIVTDPVTCPGYTQGLLLFGMGVGLVTYIIRATGAYPEGIAFGVLLMNALSPLIDHVFAARESTA